MLNQTDLNKLAPYLAKGKVVNIEVKDRGRKGREVLLEYDNGDKLVGDLNQTNFQMRPLKGLTSIASYLWQQRLAGQLLRAADPRSAGALQARYLWGLGRGVRHLH